jgi:uncharacterized PurR-regulated membrane protein YhhQ (DUF165 family)
MKKLTIPASYLAAIVAANVLTERFGLVPVGFGLVTTAGTYAAAWVILSRNFAQDAIGRLGVIGLMVVGAVLSWWLASPALAVASLVAFALSETADMVIYTPLRDHGRSRAVAIASTVGAVVDTFVFLAIAGFPIAQAAPGQLIVKVGMALLAALVLRGIRALHGESMQSEAQPAGGASHA